MSNESKQLAAKAKGIDAKQVGNALLNNALIIIMLANRGPAVSKW